MPTYGYFIIVDEIEIPCPLLSPSGVAARRHCFSLLTDVAVFDRFIAPLSRAEDTANFSPLLPARQRQVDTAFSPAAFITVRSRGFTSPVAPERTRTTLDAQKRLVSRPRFRRQRRLHFRYLSTATMPPGNSRDVEIIRATPAAYFHSRRVARRDYAKPALIFASCSPFTICMMTLTSGAQLLSPIYLGDSAFPSGLTYYASTPKSVS